MTCSHWLMMQSVTSYIYHPGTGPGVCCLLIVHWLVKHSVVKVSTPPCTGSTVHFRQQPLLRGTSSRASAPRYIPFCVLPWSQPNLARRSGAPSYVRYLHTVYREHVINVLIVLERNCVRVVPELGSRIHWSRDEPWVGALRSMGDHSVSLVEVKNIHNEKASIFRDARR